MPTNVRNMLQISGLTAVNAADVRRLMEPISMMEPPIGSGSVPSNAPLSQGPTTTEGLHDQDSNNDQDTSMTESSSSSLIVRTIINVLIYFAKLYYSHLIISGYIYYVHVIKHIYDGIRVFI